VKLTLDDDNNTDKILKSKKTSGNTYVNSYVGSFTSSWFLLISPNTKKEFKEESHGVSTREWRVANCGFMVNRSRGMADEGS
jgi:hypothetical protein